jgi:hypothetical protein
MADLRPPECCGGERTQRRAKGCYCSRLLDLDSRWWRLYALEMRGQWWAPVHAPATLRAFMSSCFLLPLDLLIGARRGNSVRQTCAAVRRRAGRIHARRTSKSPVCRFSIRAPASARYSADVEGRFSWLQALTLLLAGTSRPARTATENAFTVVPAATAPSSTCETAQLATYDLYLGGGRCRTPWN